MTEDLDGRLRRLRASDGRRRAHRPRLRPGRRRPARDAEECFRRATGLGARRGAFDLGNELAAQARWEDAARPTRSRWPAARPTPGATSGWCSSAWRHRRRDVGLPRRCRRRRRHGGCSWRCCSQPGRGRGARGGRGARRDGRAPRRRGPACWRWCAVRDPGLEDGPSCRADPARRPARPRRPAATTGRTAEARWVLERGASWGAVHWLPLGNFYADEMRDVEAAEEAYRAGIAAGTSTATTTSACCSPTGATSKVRSSSSTRRRTRGADALRDSALEPGRPRDLEVVLALPSSLGAAEPCAPGRGPR